MSKFKVGDYVLATGQFPAGEKGFVRDIDGCLYAVEFDAWREGHRCDGLFSAPSGWKMLGENLAHASWDRDPRVLRIQEGRYYKTRDGRKVGPVSTVPVNVEVDREGRKHAWYVPEHGSFDKTGAWLGGGGNNNNDLIAEWTEPSHKGCAAAEVDNLRDEYGPVGAAPAVAAKPAPAAKEAKFKVGDRVRFRSDLSGENSAFAGRSATIFAVVDWPYDWSVRLDEKHIKGHSCGGSVAMGLGRWVDSIDLEPVEKADAPLLVSITADTSALDAAIDLVKARLDDLEAHAARLGVKLGVSDLRDAA